MHQVCTGVSDPRLKQVIKSINSHTIEKEKSPYFQNTQIHVDQNIYVFKTHRYV